jgi:tetratricopeptide (TPR) repeat protein
MLAHLFEDRDDLAEAEPLLREAIALRTVALGAEHPQTGDLYADLGRVLHKRKDPAAEWFLRRGLDLKPASSGAGDMLYLSGVLAGRGDMAAAESLAQATLVMLRQLTPEGWGVASALVTLGRIRLARGDPAGAERLLREGLSMTEKFVPGKFHHAEAKRLLGVALATQGRYAEAEPHLLAGAELLGETIGTQDTLAFQVLRDVIALYETWGRPERAREFRQRLERAGASQ